MFLSVAVCQLFFKFYIQKLCCKYYRAFKAASLPSHRHPSISLLHVIFLGALHQLLCYKFIGMFCAIWLAIAIVSLHISDGSAMRTTQRHRIQPRRLPEEVIGFREFTTEDSGSSEDIDVGNNIPNNNPLFHPFIPAPLRSSSAIQRSKDRFTE
jgi:hypothetical protein